MKIALTIAGADPTASAGVGMDVKVFHRFKVYGMAVTTAATVQTARGFELFSPLPVDIVARQLDRLLATVRPAAVKTGMLATGEIVRVVAESVGRRRIRNLVVDPVLCAKNGQPLIDDEGVEVLKTKLLPLSALVTPNLFEASVLAGFPVQTLDQMREAAVAIRRLGPGAVVVKGGHLPGLPVDIFYDGRRCTEFTAPRVRFSSVHGTGCAYSAAVCAALARGMTTLAAVLSAKRFITRSINRSVRFRSGYRFLQF